MEQKIQASLQPILDLFSGKPVIQGLSIILLTLFGASFFTWIVFFFIKKLTKRTRIDLDDQIATILRPPVYYGLLMSGFSAGLKIMALTEGLTVLLTRCLQSGGVLIWTYFAIRLASLLLERVTHLSKKYSFIQTQSVTLFDNLAKVVIFGIGAYLFFVIWDIDMTAWLASAGIVGIAIGFAAKDTLANLFSGVFILADAPYKIGDYVVFDNGDRGKVTQIGLRSTRLLTRDDVEITVPNSIIGNSTIFNQSGGPYEKFRLRVKVGVAYGTDIDRVRSILLNIAKNDDLVCKTPAPRVRFRVFGASSLDFELLCWAKSPEMKGRTLDQLNDAIYKAFTKKGIEIPYAKQDLYIRRMPEEPILGHAPGQGLSGDVMDPNRST